MNLHKLKEIYYGSQDAVYSSSSLKLFKPPTHCISTQTLEFQLNEISLPNGIVTCNIPTSTYSIYKHPRLIGVQKKNIEWVELEIGGQRIDKIYPDTFDALHWLFNIPKHSNEELSILDLPFDLFNKGLLAFGLYRHKIKIRIKFSSIQSFNVSLKLDSYKYDRDIVLNTTTRKMLSQLIGTVQFNGICGGLCFNHPVIGLLADIPSDEDVLLKFDDNELKIPKSKLKIFDSMVYIPLIPDNIKQEEILKYGINFSRIDRVELLSKHTRVYAFSANLIRTRSGMTGLAFSK